MHRQQEWEVVLQCGSAACDRTHVLLAGKLQSPYIIARATRCGRIQVAAMHDMLTGLQGPLETFVLRHFSHHKLPLQG